MCVKPSQPGEGGRYAPPPRWDFVLFSHVQTCWVEGGAGLGLEGAALLKNLLALQAGGVVAALHQH